MKIIAESNIYNEIPTLLYYPEDGENLPLIIFCHGFGNDKFEGSNLSLKLALEGYAVLCFDIYRHGSRYDGFMENIDSDASFGMALFSVIENTHKDIDLLINIFAKDARVNIDKLGFVGYSLGANICNYELVNRKNISICVSILGSPNFVDLLTHGMEKDNVDQFETSEEIELLEYVETLDPIEKLRNSEVDCSWLMINAKKDENIPLKYSSDLFTEIKGIWKSNIEFRVEDEYHHVSNSMIDNTVSWIKKYFL